MSQLLISLVLLVFLAMPSMSQEQGTESEPAAETPADVAGQDAEDERLDEPVVDDEDLDEQTYEEDEDDFVPTEEIPADEAIPFPSNI